jgi:hypothetical protein
MESSPSRYPMQAELVRQFRENCMGEKTARRLERAGSMAEAWAMMDDFYHITQGLMVEFQGLVAIKKRQFERQHDHYFLIQYSISAADEGRQGHLLLVFTNIEEMLRALPQREKTLWWEAWGHMGSKDLGSTFSAFVEERLDWSLAQMTGAGAYCAKPTLTPTTNHKQDDGAGNGKRVKRGDGHEMSVRNPRAVRSPAGRNTVRPGRTRRREGCLRHCQLRRQACRVLVDSSHRGIDKPLRGRSPGGTAIPQTRSVRR